MLSPECLDPVPEEKLTELLIFTLLCGTGKRFYEGLHAVYKTFLRCHKKFWKSRASFFSTKCFATPGMLRVKILLGFYRILL